MSDSLKAANQQLGNIQEKQQVAETSTAAQQSDNVTHALAGAGGGLLSMALTYVQQLATPLFPIGSTDNCLQISPHHSVNKSPSRVQALLDHRHGRRQADP